MTRTNRQHVLNLADDGGAHVFEHDTAAASAVGSEYVAPDPQQPATYILTSSTSSRGKAPGTRMRPQASEIPRFRSS